MAYNLGPLTDAENRFRRDFVDFARLWADVKEDWLDDRCERFEKEHLASLGPSLNRFTAALHEFTAAVRKADRALLDDDSPSDGL
ncbi:MAG: hypothetical protein HKN47_02855 [Pirellulaceae bacterium]|nr:hypothetical protein [Pirellulaceae bacterium]